MLDFYLERSYKNKVISEKVFNNKSDDYLFLYSSFNNYYNSFKYCNNSKIRRFLKMN